MAPRWIASSRGTPSSTSYLMNVSIDESVEHCNSRQRNEADRRGDRKRHAAQPQRRHAPGDRQRHRAEYQEGVDPSAPGAAAEIVMM